MSGHDTLQVGGSAFDKAAMNRAIDKVLAFKPQQAAGKRQPRQDLDKRDRRKQNSRQPNTARA